MTRIIWITGRAASGKSTLVGEIETRLRERDAGVHRLCDEDILFDLKTADTGHEHHWHPHSDPNRFLLRSGHFFDQGIRIISTGLVDLIGAGGSPVALIELARGRTGPIDVSYRRALQLIDPRIWAYSFVFRLDLPFYEQVARNRQRAAQRGRATPADALHDLYRDDDPQTFIDAGIPVTTLQAQAHPQVNAAIVLTATDLDT